MKALFSTLAGLTIVIILAAVIVGSIFWSRLPDMLANHLSAKIKVAVSIANLRAKWGEIDINKIQIANLPKSVLANAFTCEQIAIITPYSNYLNQNIVIDEISLDSVYLGLEFDSATGTSGNWTRIMSHLQNSSEDGEKSRKKKRKEEDTSLPSKASRTLLIRKLILTNIDTDVVYRKDGSKIHKLPRIPRIELTNISSEGGVPMDQIMKSVLGEMLKQVFLKQNLKNMFQELLKPDNVIKDYLSPLKGLFNANPQAKSSIDANS